ncbi:MAG: hypothetical protein V4739_17365 [Pseudomonadota bacterium]
MSLREQQAALMAALSGQGPMAAGWDADRVRATAVALVHKRSRSVARTWPSLKAMLVDDYVACFARYASQHPLPREGGALADGRAFARWLAPLNDWSDAVHRQALQVDLHHAQDAAGLRVRRGPSVRLAWLPGARCWLLGMRWPGWGEREFSLRWVRGQHRKPANPRAYKAD